MTDRSWFDHLYRIGPDEVNFWQPSGSRTFRALSPGEPFLFKLHSPENFVVGGGFFVRYSALPASLAWDAFKEKNGVATHAALLSRIAQYRRSETTPDPIIGCNVLAEPFFLPRDMWIAAPNDWSANIVQGKTYDSGEDEGRRLWDFVRTSRPIEPRAQEPAIWSGQDGDEASSAPTASTDRMSSATAYFFGRTCTACSTSAT